jgi:hypothetical protein
MELFQDDEFCHLNPLNAVPTSVVEMDRLGKMYVQDPNTKKAESLLTFE